MNLRTIRALYNKSQQDVEQGSEVFQTRISQYEKNLITLTDEEKERIEKFFGGLKINWAPRRESSPLSPIEWREIKPLINHYMERNEKKTIRWVKNFNTNRALYNTVKEILDNKVIMVRGFKYKNGRGVPDVPKMKWHKDGTPDYRHLKKD